MHLLCRFSFLKYAILLFSFFNICVSLRECARPKAYTGWGLPEAEPVCRNSIEVSHVGGGVPTVGATADC